LDEPSAEDATVAPAGLRVLYLVNGFPWPLTSGYLRHYFLIQELSRRGHRISLLAIVPSGFDAANRAALEPYTERIVTVDSHRRSRSLRHRAERRLGSISVGESAARRLREEVADLLAKVPHDVVLFSGKRTFPALGAAEGIPIVADVCDATSTRIRGNLRHTSPARFPLLLAEYFEVRRIERTLIGHAAHVLFASVRDRAALIDASNIDRATVLPNGVDLDYWRRPEASLLGRDEVVFTGAMDYPPNTDAALFLAREVMPLVRAEIPTAHLSIVGRDPAEELIRAGQERGVTVTGLVPDVRPYLTAAAVFAAPLRFGSGIQNKVLEALAMDLPTVASPNAAGGLVTIDGVSPPLTVARASDPAAFAAALVERLRAAAADPTPPTDGRAFVGRNFSWARSGDLLDRALRDAAARGR
jgi:glycosyltransferase involved in cell wall biosynthesis